MLSQTHEAVTEAPAEASGDSSLKFSNCVYYTCKIQPITSTLHQKGVSFPLWLFFIEF